MWLPDATRHRLASAFLADPATGLDALLAWLASESAGTEELAWLTELAVKLG